MKYTPEQIAAAHAVLGTIINEKSAVRALEAIKARIMGEWDNSALKSTGALSTNLIEDILRIIKLVEGDTKTSKKRKESE